MRWIFQQRATGRSVAGIARELNDRGIPCPSSADRDRSRHRTKHEWIVRTVFGILENPRYTGRQVWNRHSASTTGAAHHGDPVRPSAARGRAKSDKVTHPALVDEATFLAIQGIRAARPTKYGGTRTYVLAGLVQCQFCGRRLDSHWVNGRPGYRCRHGPHQRPQPPTKAREERLRPRRPPTRRSPRAIRRNRRRRRVHDRRLPEIKRPNDQVWRPDPRGQSMQHTIRTCHDGRDCRRPTAVTLTSPRLATLWGN
ncbi:recombinase family protein [Amycolatopsis sp. NPDC003865]